MSILAWRGAADPKGLAAARRLARWELGDRSWADRILAAYFHSDPTNEFLDDAGADPEPVDAGGLG